MPISDLLAQNPTPNILILITDQERNLQTWPASYQQTLLNNMPATRSLMQNGLNLPNAFTSACMCSPSRATFLTSQYPVVTGVTNTGSPEPGNSLPLPPSPPDPKGFNNLATVLNKAGYACYWTGKWHVGLGSSSSSLDDYGFQGWDPPDSGNTLGTTYLGGGTIGPKQTNRNDPRYLADAKSFLSSPPAGPWCLVVSFVNPHDIHLGYERQSGKPDQTQASRFYSASDYQGFGAPLPSNDDENLATADKPRAQALKAWNATINPGSNITPPTGTNAQQDFIDFYAYLISHVEGQMSDLLGCLSGDAVKNTLVIRFADHGEMGLSHNLVEKFDSAYEEIMNVPLVFSNPIAWPSATESDALVSLVDLAPTLANLFGVEGNFQSFTGKNIVPVLNDPKQSVQDVVHYTYDDMEGPGPSVIRAIRTKEHKYAVYFYSTDQGSGGPYPGGDWEMYDLTSDPDENSNLAGNPAHAAKQSELGLLLQSEMKDKNTLPSFTWPPPFVAGSSRGGPP